jgi:signal transduction histidine kinase
MEQLRPRDLFYQVLDALRSITHYDHSSALHVMTADGAALELVAEQLAWQKGGSRRIGQKIDVDSEVRERLAALGAVRFTRGATGWCAAEGTGAGAASLAALLDSKGPADGAGGIVEREMLCAPIATRRGIIGVLKVSAARPGLLGEFELDVLRQFAPHASVAIQYRQTTASLRGRIIEAERKSAVATIARGVAHDVNNALGSVLPLVQQLRVDLAAGRLDRGQLEDDLRQTEQAVQYCRRIFRSMTSFASASPGRVGSANVRRAVDGTLAMLKSSFDRAAVGVEVDIVDDVPNVRGLQGDIERLLFNLATNARDAMPQGGRLSIRVRTLSDGVELRVRDTGQGMTPEILERIYEPGYTTKDEGSGLGLAVCRAIVWSAGGEMALESAPGRGTEVRVLLPVAEAEGTVSRV